MKKHIRPTILMLLAVSMLMAGFTTAQAVEPRYTGITRINSTLTISAKGAARCTGEIMLRPGYTADLTVELKQDGTIIKTQTGTGSGTISAGGTYFVTSGHDYVVTTTATVYDSNGKIVESPSKDSAEVSY